MKKFFWLLSMFLIMTGICMSLASCASGKDSGEELETEEYVELEFWNVFTGPDGNTMQNMIDDFNEEHTGSIKITSRVMASEDYYTTLLSAMVGGTAPDVCIMHCSRLAYFANKNLLYPLEETVQQLGIDSSEFIKVAWDAGEYGEVRYGIPLDVHPLGLYYNKTLLQKMGYYEPAKDLDAFLEMAEDCTYDNNGDRTTDVWGFAIDPNVMSEQLFWSLLYQFGGQVFSEDGTAAAYNSDAGVEALQLMYDMIYKYNISQQGLLPDSALTMFEEGTLAFYVNGPWILSELEACEGLDFGTAVFPEFGETNAVWADSHNLVIPKQREMDDNKIKAIRTFMDYLLEHELEWAAAGHVPALKTVLEDEAFQELQYLQPFAEQLDYVKLPYGSPYYDNIWEPVQEHLSEVLLNTLRPENMLINAEKEAESRFLAK